MAKSDHLAGRRQGLSVLGLPVLGHALLGIAFLVSGTAGASAQALSPVQPGADFVCRGFATQICHFAVLRQAGPRTDFALVSGQARHVEDVAQGVDRYMVTVNFPAPDKASACSRAPASGKRSAWCKLSTVSSQAND